MARKYCELSGTEQSEFARQLCDMYYAPMEQGGMGLADEWFCKSTMVEVLDRFRDENGRGLTMDALYDRLQNGQYVYGYCCGELMPSAIQLSPQGKPVVGIGLGDLREQVCPSKIEKVLQASGMRWANKKAEAYNDFNGRRSHRDLFSTAKELRREGAQLELGRAAMRDADKTHAQQKANIQKTRQERYLRDPENAFFMSERWVNVSFEEFCCRIAEKFALSCPGMREEDKQSLQEDIAALGKTEDMTPGQREFRKLLIDQGRTIFQKAVQQGRVDVVEAMVAELVDKEPTHRESRDLYYYMMLGHVDRAHWTDARYAGVNFGRVADPTRNNTADDKYFVAEASRFMNARRTFDSTVAYLAMAAYRVPVLDAGGGNFGRKLSGIELVGRILCEYQDVCRKLAQSRDVGALALDDDTLDQISRCLYFIGSFNDKGASARSECENFLPESYIKNRTDMSEPVEGEALLTSILHSARVRNMLASGGLIVCHDLTGGYVSNLEDVVRCMSNQQYILELSRAITLGLQEWQGIAPIPPLTEQAKALNL